MLAYLKLLGMKLLFLLFKKGFVVAAMVPKLDRFRFDPGRSVKIFV